MLSNHDTKNVFLKLHDGFRLVQDGNYAFHAEANTAFPTIRCLFTPRQLCDLNVLKFRRENIQSFVLRKNSPFHDAMAIK